jgi:hypothetical protein
VRYDTTDRNPTTEQLGEQHVAEAEAINGEEGVVAPNEAAPNSPNTPASSQGQNQGWVTPPGQNSGSLDKGPVKFRTLRDLFDSIEEVLDYEYNGVCMLAADEPANVEQALEETCWKDAMRAKLEAIVKNNTWEFSELSKDHKAIGLKWMFKVKRDLARNIVKHKARLVVKGYAQVHGVYYDEVFSPVARMETVRLLLALAAQGEWEVHHMDVKSAFLNGDLKEDVYVQQPPGFVDPRAPRRVLKLKKALYGLKQALRAWNDRLDLELSRLGFRKSVEENVVYKRGSGRSLLLVGVYVDDLVICGPNKNVIAKFKQQMKESFSMSDLGLLSYYLGLEVKQKPGEITISQSAYAKKIVDISGMKGCNPVDTPMEQHVKLLPGKPELVSNAKI